eukprot:313930-Pelagomonas_calceolata.AAC.3
MKGHKGRAPHGDYASRDVKFGSPSTSSNINVTRILSHLKPQTIPGWYIGIHFRPHVPAVVCVEVVVVAIVVLGCCSACWG